ncbi:MAG: T9SS type A sorting domain-containing protein [Bacteroidetes bacterium]|nr:T9SS type A sorting domain-containing protein [Bacteroidota bacterium]
MKKTILLFSLFMILFSRVELFSADYTAYEGYQLIKAQMESEFYDLSNVNLIAVMAGINSTFDIGNGMMFDMITHFEGEDIGKSNFWIYYINYKEDDYNTFLVGLCAYIYGMPIVQVTPLDEETMEAGDFPSAQKFINLTEENDSPVFIKKLVETSNFVESIPELYDTPRSAGLVFSYISAEDLKIEFPFQDAPYWQASSNNLVENIEKTCILLADENIINNDVQCFEAVYEDENESILENNVDISIYPNPVVENINITIPEELKNNVTSIQLFDANGSLLDNINTYNYNVSNLANGTYYICFTINNCKYYRAFIVAN